MSDKQKTWGNNAAGQQLKEHDKLLCGNGIDVWFTHVQIDPDNGKWHREQDYFNSKKVGEYER